MRVIEADTRSLTLNPKPPSPFKFTTTREDWSRQDEERLGAYHPLRLGLRAAYRF